MTSPAPTRALRRSCQFCRARKVRCSGQEKCDACRERNIDCIYGLEAPKGRPRKRTRSSLATQGIDVVENLATSILPTPHDYDSRSDTSRGSAPPGSSSPADLSSPGTRTLASEFETMYEQSFGDPTHGGKSTNIYQLAIEAFVRRTKGDPSMEQPINYAIMSYDSMQGVLTQELVEILSTKYGRLDCLYLGESRGKFYLRCLATDPTLAMFHGIPLSHENPIDLMSASRVVELIGAWFSVHPISIIVSKTLLLQQYKNKTYDPLLLCVIISQALYVNGDPQSELYFNHGISVLRKLPANTCDLSTAQSLLLLGWHDICLTKARRGTCFVGYACRMVTKLMKSPKVPTSRVNGVDAGEVEAELMKYIYWILLSATLWTFMQFDQPFSADMLPSPTAMGFPPPSESESMIYKLDLASGNTFQRQGKMIGGLWVLSHIASTIGHIYALFPRANEPPNSDWGVDQISEIQSFNPEHDMMVLCSRVKDILVTASKQLSETLTISEGSRAVLLIAYHTLIVHFIFPRFGTQPLPDVLDTLVSSSCALIQVAKAEEALIGSKMIWYSTANADPFTANMLMLGIDACARALNDIKSRDVLLPRRTEFIKLARKLLEITKMERLAVARRARMVKKYLKGVIAYIEDEMPVAADTSSPLPDSFGLNNAGFSGGSLHSGQVTGFEELGDFGGFLASDEIFPPLSGVGDTAAFFPSPVFDQQHAYLSIFSTPGPSEGSSEDMIGNQEDELARWRGGY
ncbi:hypothetical protein L873DRAFT_1762642 [Choiromyces venosus 120613-1]|uniref:Zn(2)-C6 fungal-type domain-containing protein n=1 Tax=Choiromyces venosus 120613-1 TaxID=1336337 RepID=A0A3N4JZP3_9PEZI|nr:hypothetical protein L873DRAFT_1762642 [Choiromyces venosus 120613-1]